MLTFFRTQWRWLAFVLAIVLVLGSAAGYVATSCQRARTVRRIEGVAQQHAERVAGEPARQHHFDSTFYSLAGQAREARRQLTLQKRQDDSLSRLLPAAPELPVAPPRY